MSVVCWRRVQSAGRYRKCTTFTSMSSSWCSWKAFFLLNKVMLEERSTKSPMNMFASVNSPLWTYCTERTDWFLLGAEGKRERESERKKISPDKEPWQNASPILNQKIQEAGQIFYGWCHRQRWLCFKESWEEAAIASAGQRSSHTVCLCSQRAADSTSLLINNAESQVSGFGTHCKDTNQNCTVHFFHLLSTVWLQTPILYPCHCHLFIPWAHNRWWGFSFIWIVTLQLQIIKF